MDLNNEENLKYLRDVIAFFESLLLSKEKKRLFMHEHMKKQWDVLQSENEAIFLCQIRQRINMSDTAYFILLLAISLELSSEVQASFVRLYQKQHPTSYLGLQLYQDIQAVQIEDRLLPMQEFDWHIFYTNSRKDDTYIHETLLLLQPWVLAYVTYGGIMRCRYSSFAYSEDEVYLSETDSISFLNFMSQGMKAIVCEQDETQIVNLLRGYQKTVCNIYLAYLPASWDIYKLYAFCSFYQQMLDCAFFIYYTSDTQKEYVSSAMMALPFTFLITNEELVPANIAILRTPYTAKMEFAVSNNPFIKEYPFSEELPSFIGDLDFLSRLNEFIYMAQHKEEIHQLISTDAAIKGISALFYGPSGNGKTLGARCIAKKLKKRLWQIELSNVLDKYIGESEKHLETIFHEAEKEGVVLLFDEADTLFTKRTDVKDSNDRYANAITSYLLQRMEAYPGIILLTSNFLHNFDDAFLRRITCILRFHEANKEQRLAKWQSITSHLRIDETISWDMIAEIKLSYARIDQCLFTAISFMMADNQDHICEHHLKKAITYELEKHGELPPRAWRA